MKTMLRGFWDLIWLEVRLIRFLLTYVLIPATVLLAKGIVYTGLLFTVLARKAQFRWQARRQAKADQFIC